MNHKNIFLKSAIITSIFVIFDYLAHYFLTFLNIPVYPYHYFNSATPLINYSISKILFTFIALVIFFYLFNYFKTKSKPIQYIISLVLIVGFLQIRYSTLYYSPTFQSWNLLNHFIAFSLGFYLSTKVIKNE